MDTQKFVRVIWIPLALELIKQIVHSLVRDTSSGERLQTSDIVSIVATVAILFYLGLRVASIYGGPLLKAAGMGLLVWFISTVVFVGGTGLVLSLLSAAPRSSVLTGPVVAFVLFAPAAAVVPVLGAFLGTRYKARSNEPGSD